MSDSSLMTLFDPFANHARRVLEKVADAEYVDALLGESRECFARLAPEMPYADRRDHVMWDPMLQAGVSEGSETEITDELASPALRDAAASQEGAAENESVFEIVPGEDENTDWGMNVTRCAGCHAYAKHDAMEFTPYMCATDDLVSDHSNQGLRRTGTIALGAHRCDFRYKAGGKPLRLAEQYPEKIRSGEGPIE